MNPFIKALLFYCLFAVMLPFPLKAQEKQPVYLINLLSELENKYQVTFLYDSDLLRNVKVNLNEANLTLDENLNQLNEKSAFVFEKKENNFIVKPKHPGFNLQICGKLIDTETQDPIPGAAVYNSSLTSGSYTDENGNFSIFVNLADTSKLHFHTLGYIEKIIPDDFFNGKDCQTISLQASILELEEVSIISYLSGGINYKLKDNSIEIKPGNMGLLPGETDADILMAIDALPGVNTPDSKAGNLNIRGSTPDQTLILFDNIPIYHKGHYFGTMSPYNASIVENVKVQRNAYLADKGGRVGGMIEINSKTAIPDSVMSGVSLSSTYASAYTQVPVIKKRLSLLVAGRTSYPSAWISPKMKAINEFIYQESAVKAAEISPTMDLSLRDNYFNDINSKIIAKTGKKSELNFSFLRIRNLVKLGITNSDLNSDSYDEIKLNNIGQSTVWKKQWSKKVTTQLSGTYSQYLQAFISKTTILPDSITEDATFSNQINDLSLKFSSDVIISERSSINFGYDLLHQTQKYKNSTFLAGKVPTNINTTTPSYLHSLFTTYNLTNIKKYILNLGLRTNYYTQTKSFYLEPRLMASYFLTNHLTLKSSAGVFNQFITQIYGTAIQSVGRIDNLLWLVADGDKVPVLKSKQVMIGSIYQKSSWIIDLELYYKTTNGLAVSNIVNPKSPNPYLYGSGKIYGMDLLVKKSWKKLDTWISYTLSKSLLNYDSIQSEPFYNLFDQRHVIDLVATYRIKQWKFSAGWKYRSGLAALPTIRARYLQGLQPPPLNPGPTPPPSPGGSTSFLPGSAERYTDRFPAFHQLDISIVYALPRKQKQWNSTIGLSFLNVYNRKNIIDQHMRMMPTGNLWVSRYSLGFSPNLMISVNW